MVTLWLRFKALITRRRLDRDLADELEFHLAMREEKRRAEETAPAEARAQARREFGNTVGLKEVCRDLWTFTWLETLWQDVRYGLRMLRRSPAFTAVAVLSLAIGIGANTAIFSLVNAILLRSMPVRNPEQLRLVFWTGIPSLPKHNSSGYDATVNGVKAQASFSYPMYQRFAASVPQFSDLMAFALAEMTVVARGESRYAGAFLVSGNFLTGLGVNPRLGRLLLPEDDKPGAPPVAVISYQFWEQRFGLDPAVIGQDIIVNGRPVMVVGIAPRSFLGLWPGWLAGLYIPITSAGTWGPKEYHLAEDDWWVQIMGRLRPGVSGQQAQAALATVMEQANSSYAITPDAQHNPWRPAMQEGGRGIQLLRDRARGPLSVLGAVVGLVLLIACANIANLLLARGTARRREIAVRLSIGAGRWRLVRQLSTESFLLAALGAGIGLTFAPLLANTVFTLANGSDPLVLETPVDARTLLFTAGTAFITTLLFGLMPALRATRLDLTPALKGVPAGMFGSRPQTRMSRFLLIGQVALSTLLLTGAALFTRTLINVATVDPGFNTRQLLLFDVDGGQSGYQGDKLVQLYERIRVNVASIPGVQAATLSMVRLIAGFVSSSDIMISGKPGDAYVIGADSRFLTRMGIPILLGRDIDERDTSKVPKVAVVNETFARKYLADQAPLGRIFQFRTPDGKADPKDAIQVIGVCQDARYDTLKGAITPTAYLPYAQHPSWMRRATFEVRTAIAPATIAGAVRRAVAEIDRNVPVAERRTQEEQIQQSLGLERLFAGLVGWFGLTAALLVAIGLYGLMAYAVTRRTAEIGIRLALGAIGSDVQWMVLRESLFMVGIGMAVGVPAAFALTRLVRESLYGVAPTDPVSFVAAGLLMLVVASVAAWIPARRASRIDPMRALRHE